VNAKIKVRELESTFDVPAIRIDNVYCTTTGADVRLTFVETVPDVEAMRPRAAVSMSLQNAMNLYAVLGQLAKQLEAQNENKDTVQ